MLLKWHQRGSINFSVGPVRFNSVDLSLSGWFSTCIPGHWGLERWVLSARIHLGPDPLLSHSRIMALQLTWLQWCNTDKSESSISPVRSDQPECENSCGDGVNMASCTQRGLTSLLGWWTGRLYSPCSCSVTLLWGVCWNCSSQMESETWLSSFIWTLNVSGCVLWRKNKNCICTRVRRSPSHLMKTYFKVQTDLKKKWSCTSPFTSTLPLKQNLELFQRLKEWWWAFIFQEAGWCSLWLMLLANLSRRICSSSLYESTGGTIPSVIQLSEHLGSIHQESSGQAGRCVRWLRCNQCKVTVVCEWNVSIVRAVCIKYIKYLHLSSFTSMIFFFFSAWESGVCMCLLNICLNSCKGFWLVGRAGKELRVGAVLDEITSASLTLLWLNAQCHWIIIKHL